MADWTEKYRPTTLREVRGNDTAVEELREWAETWDDHREAAVLHGSPGIGKTSAAHALAADMGWATVELNASDQRTADVIERYAGRAARNATLGGTDEAAGRQLVILDEADNIHGTYDRGGARAITALVKEASQPIVLIANDYYELSRGLRNATREIEFRDVSARSILPVLRDICRKEGIEFEPAALEELAERNAGDLRGAVNDLQAAAEGQRRLTLADVATGGRDRTVGLFPFLDTVLKESESARDAIQAAYDTDETPDDLTKWIEGNVLKAYTADEAPRAYDALARADVWLGRVRATQNYSYWRYATDNLAAGVAAAREGTKGGWTRWSRPRFWRSSSDTAEAVLRSIATREGTSMRIARLDVLPFLAALTHHCKPRDLTVRMAAAYDLDEAGVAFVTGSGESTNKVASIVEDATDLREDLLEEHAEGAFEVVDPDDIDAGDEDPSTTDQPDVEDESDRAAHDSDADDPETDDQQAGLTDFT